MRERAPQKAAQLAQKLNPVLHGALNLGLASVSTRTPSWLDLEATTPPREGTEVGRQGTKGA